MARYCDNDQCDGNFHTTACTEAPGLDMADETAMEDGYYRRPSRPAAVIALPQPHQEGAAA